MIERKCGVIAVAFYFRTRSGIPVTSEWLAIFIPGPGRKVQFKFSRFHQGSEQSENGLVCTAQSSHSQVWSNIMNQTGLVLCTSRADSSSSSPGVPRARAGSSLLASGFLAARTGVYERTRGPWRLESVGKGVHEPTRLQTRASWRVLGGFLAAREQH